MGFISNFIPIVLKTNIKSKTIECSQRNKQTSKKDWMTTIVPKQNLTQSFNLEIQEWLEEERKHD